MTRIRKPTKRKVIRQTLLLVGEGLAEYKFLALVKAVATRGGNGPSVTLRQASGKGALYVVEHARRQWAGTAIDKCAVLLDDDTACYERALKKAKQYGIVVMASTPCFEGSLLRAKGVASIPGRSSECKDAFKARFGGEAHEGNLLERQFALDAEMLQNFAEVEPLALLLNLLDFNPQGPR